MTGARTIFLENSHTMLVEICRFDHRHGAEMKCLKIFLISIVIFCSFPSLPYVKFANARLLSVSGLPCSKTPLFPGIRRPGGKGVCSPASRITGKRGRCYQGTYGRWGKEGLDSRAKPPGGYSRFQVTGSKIKTEKNP